MFLYIFIWCYLLFCSKFKNQQIFFINILVLSIIAGLRTNNIGTDTEAYYDLFNWINEGYGEHIEIGWRLLNRFVHAIGGSYNLLLWLVSLLTLFPLYYFFKNNSKNINLCLFIYYSLYAYCNSFNGMRQFLAVSLVFLGYDFLLQRKIIKYIVFILIAMSFHISSFLAFIPYFLKKLKLTNTLIIISLISTLFVGLILSDSIFEIILGPYSHYLTSEHGYRESSTSALIMSVLVSLMFLFLFTTSKNNFKYNFWVKLYFVGLLIMNITFKLTLGTRAILYFTLLQTVVYPLYFSNTKFFPKSPVVLGITLYLLLIFLKLLVLGNTSDNPGAIFPYSTILTS